MPNIAWQNRYSVGIGRIDDQHKKLIDMINELGRAMQEGKGKEKVSQILHGLTTYTLTHFSAEERLFAENGYPGAAAHKREHQAFVDEVTRFKQKFDSGNATVTVEVMNFLSQWLVKHIVGSDKKYADFLAKKGVAGAAG